MLSRDLGYPFGGIPAGRLSCYTCWQLKLRSFPFLHCLCSWTFQEKKWQGACICWNNVNYRRAAGQRFFTCAGSRLFCRFPLPLKWRLCTCYVRNMSVNSALDSPTKLWADRCCPYICVTHTCVSSSVVMIVSLYHNCQDIVHLQYCQSNISDETSSHILAVANICKHIGIHAALGQDGYITDRWVVGGDFWKKHQCNYNFPPDSHWGLFENSELT